MGTGANRAGWAALAGLSIGLIAGEADAANNAYAVDAADISETGSCKYEGWLSSATNRDFIAVANPSCVVDPLKVKPVELSALTNYARGEGNWSTTISPKAKMNFLPTGVGRLGVSGYVNAAFDTASGENVSIAAVIPVTYRLSETMRINLNGGWLWDRTVDQHYLVYGIGFDWKFTDMLQWTIEVFGQAGKSDTPSVVRPRFQTGLRYRPDEIFSIDVIYGHNITGENASWITIGTTIRFPVQGGQSDRQRSGHL
jgi:hypothetical protein